MPALPALFVSHGSPRFALEPGLTGPALTRWGRALAAHGMGSVRGVVLMSPHWMPPVPTVMTTEHPATWHDFGGFPSALYKLQYPAPGDPALGQEVIALLAQAGIDAEADAQRPLDHGAWVPLMHLLPDAAVPVVQVALPALAGPPQVLGLGHALAPLRERGILIIGSGSMTHNLREFYGGEREAAAYVTAFSRWVENTVTQGDLAAMLDYRQRAPHAQHAHPSEEHFLPIFFALGAGGWDGRHTTAIQWLSREVVYGVLAMDSFAVG